MMTPEEQKEAEIQALKAQNRLLEMENNVLKKFQALEREMIQRENKSRHTKRSKR
ncbi:ISSth1, transposase [Staphylococcus aureus]|nr:ISSth1, transposase [Staphylococcus aureus]